MYRLLIIEDDKGIAEAIKTQAEMWGEIDGTALGNRLFCGRKHSFRKCEQTSETSGVRRA